MLIRRIHSVALPHLRHVMGRMLVCMLLPAAAAGAAGAAEGPVNLCLAPASASIIGISGSEAGQAVDGMVSSYLAGPSIRLVPLESRVSALARREAADKDCAYVLFTTVKHERRSSGMADRLAAGAVQSGAGNAAVLADSAGARILAGAAAGAAGAVATSGHVRTRDELSLGYQLETPAGDTITKKSITRRARSDGEDVLTAMVESLAENVAASIFPGG